MKVTKMDDGRSGSILTSGALPSRVQARKTSDRGASGGLIMESVEPEYVVLKVVYKTRNRGARESVHFQAVKEGIDYTKTAEAWCRKTNVALQRCRVLYARGKTLTDTRYAARKLAAGLDKERRHRRSST